MNRVVRILALPFSWIYGAVVFLYHRQYDAGIKKSVSFSLPVISVGNLSVGGTGKTPLTEYLILLLKTHSSLGMLSRGYRRRSKGYLEVETEHSYTATGDEPLQVKRKFPDVLVAVSESRVLGVVNMVNNHPETEIVILDDAFQHRSINPGFSILVTDYSRPFHRDRLLPAGRLREPVAGAQRSDVVVVSKCPSTLNSESRNSFRQELARHVSRPVFFSMLEYGTPYQVFDQKQEKALTKDLEVLFFCGIANPAPLVNYLEAIGARIKMIRYGDHHPFTLPQIKQIEKEYQALPSVSKMLLTTEKDAVRLVPFKEYLASQQLEIYCVPVQMAFFEEDKTDFDQMVTSFVNNFKAEQ